MSTAHRRRKKPAGAQDPAEYRALEAAVKLALCSGRAEAGDTRRLHLAGLLAWTTDQQRCEDHLLIRFSHSPTAWWVYEVLSSPRVIVDLDSGVSTVRIGHPQRVLGPYGYRGGRWLAGHGPAAALGAVRGAIHATATFDRTGMTVYCPSAPMTLNLTGLMRRLDIDASPAGLATRINTADIAHALTQIGLDPDVVDAQRLRELARKGRTA